MLELGDILVAPAHGDGSVLAVTAIKKEDSFTDGRLIEVTCIHSDYIEPGFTLEFSEDLLVEELIPDGNLFNQTKRPECECGALKCGNNRIHSTWCPIYE